MRSKIAGPGLEEPPCINQINAGADLIQYQNKIKEQF